MQDFCAPHPAWARPVPVGEILSGSFRPINAEKILLA
jgi:hypothetical protein